MTTKPNSRGELVGYFNHYNNKKPTYNPPKICLLCCEPIKFSFENECKTISLMAEKGNRSYFYRVHKDCYEKATPDEIQLYESSIIDNQQTK